MNVLITGASKGIGFETALAFCRYKKFNLFLLSRDNEKLDFLKNKCLEIDQEARLTLICYDLQRLSHDQEEFGNLLGNTHFDIVINNAGLLINKAFHEVSFTEAQAVLNTNFMAPAFLIRNLLSKLGGLRPSHVVNISSMGGVQGSSKYPGLTYYSASKGALAILTEALAVEYFDKNISFNCLALGAVQTEMLSDAFPGYKAPLSAPEMAKFITDFAINGNKYFNGKIVPVALSNP